MTPELRNLPDTIWAHLQTPQAGLFFLVVAVLVGLSIWHWKCFRSGIIARATMVEAIRQPIFLLILVTALILNVLNTIVPFFSLGDDYKMLMDCGLATILICSLLLATWTASTSIADEIEGKTAMTVLSKPINRRQFIIGKYVGIMQAILVMMIPVAICLLFLLYFKVGYDARESGVDVTKVYRMGSIYIMLPNLLLVLMEIAVLTAISVAISTRLPMIVNMVVTFTIFVLGHLSGVIVKQAGERLEQVEFVARLLSTILPSLGSYKTDTSIATSTMVPAEYLGYASVYTCCYILAAILFAFILFEDRDLA